MNVRKYHEKLERHRMRRQAKTLTARQRRIGVPKPRRKGAFGEVNLLGRDWYASLAKYFGMPA
jgi:hypothetical protein